MPSAVPNKTVGCNCHVVGGALPFAHQYGPGARQLSCRRMKSVAYTDHAVEQSIQFFGDRLRKAALKLFLHCVGDTECEDVPTNGRRRAFSKFLFPKIAKLG